MALGGHAIALALGAGLLTASMASATPLPNPLIEDEISFQDGAGNAKTTFFAGAALILYVKDADLGTLATSTAVWSGTANGWTADTWWSLATGEPEAGVYALEEGSAYSRATPSDTPLHTLLNADVSGIEYLFDNFRPLTGELQFLNAVNPATIVRVDFSFEVVDLYGASKNRVRVSSTADPEGEWIALTEVTSEANSQPGPTSGLFRGETLLSADASTVGDGDVSVWVQDGDVMTAAYFEGDGVTEIASHQASVQAVQPTPTPVPSVGLLALGLLAALLALGVGSRLRTSS